MKWTIASRGVAASGLCVVLVGCATAPPAPRNVPVIERGSIDEPAIGVQALPPQEPSQSPVEPPPLPEAEAPAVDKLQARERPTTPVVVALLDAADRHTQAGQLAAAAASLERALHIDPRNPEPWYQLAVVRFREGYLDQAEQLARKAEALAGGDTMVRARSWRLIAAAREEAGDFEGAHTARQRAEALYRSE